jgi:hypothetical protein
LLSPLRYKSHKALERADSEAVDDGQSIYL